MPALSDYKDIVGSDAIARITKKAEPLRGKKIIEINSALSGGGVAELLVTQVELLRSLGIESDRHVIAGSEAFFNVTKKIHNALQSEDIQLTESEKQLYESTVQTAATAVPHDSDLVMVHDPQPLPLIETVVKQQPWAWRCHVDLSSPNKQVWDYLSRWVERYDSTVVSLPKYRQNLTVPQVVSAPAIDPLSTKNLPLEDSEIIARLERYGIPTNVPLIVQVSRFDKWKDPAGVIEAFDLIRDKTNAVLVLLGNFVVDDPESQELFRAIQRDDDQRVLILPHGDDLELVSALQWRADIVVQKSLREGFGLTVTEAMWRGKPVLGGDTDGIRAQIQHSDTGFIVSSVAECADYLEKLLGDQALCREIGTAAKESVRKSYLFPRMIEDIVDLYVGLLKA